jgi:hypothetical protein
MNLGLPQLSIMSDGREAIEIAINSAGTTLLSKAKICTLVIAFAVLGAMAQTLAADEKEDVDKQLADQRLNVMKDRIGAVMIQSESKDFPSKFSGKPLFRYTDPARGYVAASVWRLGEFGRPKAIIATELNPAAYKRPSICYEYASLTDEPFIAKWQRTEWSPKGTLYRFKSIPNAPTPEATPALRLIQLRALARRFTADEVVDGQKYELRLLPQPVDRYVPSREARADGAIFFFTFGTNPEVVLLIESDGSEWTYGVGRLTGAQEVSLKLEDSIVWHGEPLESGTRSPFTGHIEPVEIPGIAENGSEIRK